MSEAIGQPREPVVLKWLSYLRYVFTLPLGLCLMALWCSVFSLAAVLIRWRPLDDFIVWSWGSCMCWLYGIRVRVEGLENLPRTGCILLFNHASLFDIPIMYAHIRKHFRFGAKAELFKVPFLGLTLKTMGALPIHRGQRSEVLKLYKASVERVHAGASFALAPEGTRQKQLGIGRFKKGPFLFAVQAQAPLVPVVIKGALEILGKGDFIICKGRWTREVRLQILPAVPTEGLDEESLESLQEQTRTQFVAAYEGME